MLEDSSFDGLDELRKLEMTSNKEFAMFYPEALSGDMVPNLEILDISNNDFQEIKVWKNACKYMVLTPLSLDKIQVTIA